MKYWYNDKLQWKKFSCFRSMQRENVTIVYLWTAEPHLLLFSWDFFTENRILPDFWAVRPKNVCFSIFGLDIFTFFICLTTTSHSYCPVVFLNLKFWKLITKKKPSTTDCQSWFEQTSAEIFISSLRRPPHLGVCGQQAAGARGRLMDMLWFV